MFKWKVTVLLSSHFEVCADSHLLFNGTTPEVRHHRDRPRLQSSMLDYDMCESESESVSDSSCRFFWSTVKVTMTSNSIYYLPSLISLPLHPDQGDTEESELEPTQPASAWQSKQDKGHVGCLLDPTPDLVAAIKDMQYIWTTLNSGNTHLKILQPSVS